MPEQTDRLATVPDPSPTERAIATMHARRDTAACPLVGDEWLLLAEVERLQDVIARQAAELDTLRGDYADLRNDVADYERDLAIPGEDAA
jgi:hypothetical protein